VSKYRIQGIGGLWVPPAWTLRQYRGKDAVVILGQDKGRGAWGEWVGCAATTVELRRILKEVGSDIYLPFAIVRGYQEQTYNDYWKRYRRA
jgi:hypothetical protein